MWWERSNKLVISLCGIVGSISRQIGFGFKTINIERKTIGPVWHRREDSNMDFGIPSITRMKSRLFTGRIWVFGADDRGIDRALARG
jgi:hypothetical protein